MSFIGAKINNYFIAPLVIAIGGVLKVTQWADAINKYSPGLYLGLGIISFAGAIYIYYFSIFSPFKKYLKLQSRKYDVIAELVDKLNKDYQNKFNFSVNIMFVKRSLWFKIEPKSDANRKEAKVTIWGRRFQVIREFGDKINNELKFTINQGVCGEAYRLATNSKNMKVVGSILSGPYKDSKSMNFTEKQEDLTKELFVVVSCPLIVKTGEGDDQKLKTIGVINLHSRVEESVVLMTNKDNAKDILFDYVLHLGKIFVHLHV